MLATDSNSQHSYDETKGIFLLVRVTAVVSYVLLYSEIVLADMKELRYRWGSAVAEREHIT